MSISLEIFQKLNTKKKMFRIKMIVFLTSGKMVSNKKLEPTSSHLHTKSTPMHRAIQLEEELRAE